MRCRIGGSASNYEIPPLVTLIYLFCHVASGRPRGRPVLDLSEFTRELRRRQRQVGSLAGAAHLLNNNTGVLRLAQ